MLAYDFKMQYQNTNVFGQVDALSRLISTQAKPNDEMMIASLHVDTEIRQILSENISKLSINAVRIRKET